MKTSDSKNSICDHRYIKKDSKRYICQTCKHEVSVRGYLKYLREKDNQNMEKDISFEKTTSRSANYSDSQRNYERNIKISDSKALQDPMIKGKYERIKTLSKWFRDYESDFTEQKKTIELLKSHGIGLNIDNAKYKGIKDMYLRFNKYHRHSYQNMVIIFLAIIWMKIRETTNIRIEEFIRVSKELGHKINKKMLNNAMLKIKRTEKMLTKSSVNLEQEIKDRIKIVFQKDVNNIPYERIQEYFTDKFQFEKMRIDMLLLADKILKIIPYEHIQNLNYKAFTAGLIYYIGQTLDNKKIFTQSLIESVTKFSSTTIRKKFHVLKGILGNPHKFNI